MKMKTLLLMMTAALCLAAAPAQAVLKQDLGSVIVYPNPFQPKLNHTAVTFDNMPAAATLKIYKMTGELILEREVATTDGLVTWDTTNSGGNRVASGVYLYVLTAGGAGSTKAKGKIVILR